MQYKPAPRLEYHHVQPLTIFPPPHCPGDLNLQAMRERRKLQPVTKPQRPAPRPRVITINIFPEPAPERYVSILHDITAVLVVPPPVCCS